MNDQPGMVGQVIVPATIFARARKNGKPNVTEHLTSRVRSALLESCRDGRARMMV
ncbi:MAG TPA: hypothetical protein VF384_03420 [Planctomycetota bacterium]